MATGNQDDFKESPLPIPAWRPDPQHNEVSSLGIGLVTGTIAFFILGICALFYLHRADQRRRTAHTNAMLRRTEEGQSRRGSLSDQRPPNRVQRSSASTWKHWWKLKRTLNDDKARSNSNDTSLEVQLAANPIHQTL